MSGLVASLDKTWTRILHSSKNVAQELLNRMVGHLRDWALAERPQNLILMCNLAELYMRLGRYAEAEPLYQAVLAASEEVLSLDQLDILDKMHNLGGVYFRQNRYQEAAGLFERTLAARERLLGNEHPDTLTPMALLGICYGWLERPAEAAELLERAVEGSERVLGWENPETQSTTQCLVNLYLGQEQYEKARPLFERLAATKERQLGVEHPDTVAMFNQLATALHELACSYLREDRNEEAERTFLQALATRERVLGANHPDTVFSVENLAGFYYFQQRYDEAVPLFERVLAVKKVMEGKDEENLTSMSRLGISYLRQRRYSEAEPLVRRTFYYNKRALGPEHPETLVSLHHLAESCLGLRKFDEASRLFEVVLAARERTLAEEDANTLDSMSGLAISYLTQKRYNEAELLLKRALGISERMYGGGHPETLRVIEFLGLLYAQQNRHAEAVLLYQQLVAMYDAAGKQDLGSLFVLIELAKSYVGQEKYEQAEPLYERALSVSERLRGEHDLGTLMNNLAVVYAKQQKYDKAESLFKTVLADRERVIGSEHPDTLDIVWSLANLYKAQQKYDEAALLYERDLMVSEQLQPDEDSHVRELLISLFRIYIELSKWEKVEPLGRRLLAAHERALGPEHPTTLWCRHSLAKHYVNVGLLEKAVPLYEYELAANEKRLGAEHPDTLACVNTLAGLYSRQGRCAEARASLDHVFAVRVRALGPTHPDTLTAANNLAEFYEEQGGREEAQSLKITLKHVGRLRARVLGAEHPDTLMTAHQLACSYYRQGLYDKARALFEKLLPVRERVLGAEHPDTLMTASLLGTLYSLQEEYSKALPLCERAANSDSVAHALTLASLYVDEEKLEKAEPLLEQALACKRLPGNAGLAEVHWVASLYAKMGEDWVSKAFDLLHQNQFTHADLLLNRLNVSSPSQATLTIQQAKTELDIFISLLWRHFSTSPEHVRIAADVVLRRKGLALEAAMSQSEVLLAGRYPDLAQQVHQLTLRRTEWTRKSDEGPSQGESAEQYLKTLDQLGVIAAKLETELARQIPELRLRERIDAVNRRAVALALPQGSRLIEFLRFNVFDFEAKVTHRWKAARYVAFVLSAGAWDSIEMLDLGPAEAIDSMVRTFRQLMGREAGEEDSGSPVGSFLAQDAWNIPKQLRAAVVDPVLGNQQGQRVFFATDGELNLLPFEALPSKNPSKHLVDEHQFSYLGTGRDLLRLKEEMIAVEPGDSVVAADPAFDLTQEPESVGLAAGSDVARDLEQEGVAFPPLPGTRVEGERVARRLKVAPWMGHTVLKKRIRQVRSPKVLHAATHGYFVSDPKPVPENSELEFGVGKLLPNRLLHPSNVKNPMRRSGLALAGSQSWLIGNTLPEEAEDGLLTAEDASTMDLRGTQMVVLSACKTGVGKVLYGEGVFGLRRGFLIAGARTLVMSLWKVDDLATILLMDRFYEKLLEGSMGRNEALRDAQIYLRGVSIGDIRAEWLNDEMMERLSGGNQKSRARLEALKAKRDGFRPFVEVYYWGAFILHGDGSPLRRNADRPVFQESQNILR